MIALAKALDELVKSQAIAEIRIGLEMHPSLQSQLPSSLRESILARVQSPLNLSLK